MVRRDLVSCLSIIGGCITLSDDRKLRVRKKIPKAKQLGMRITPKRLKWDVGTALQLRVVKRLTYEQIATLLKVSTGAIKSGLRPLLSLIENPELVAAFRGQEAELMDSVRMLAMQGMAEQLNDPKRRKSMDMLRLNTLYGTLFDKQRLSRGESSQNIFQLTALISAAHKPSTNKGSSDGDSIEAEVEAEAPGSSD